MTIMKTKGNTVIWVLLAILLITPSVVAAMDGDLLWPDYTEFTDPEILLSDKAGGAIVVWNSSDEVRVQRYNGEGEPLWEADDQLIIANTGIYKNFPAATEDGVGGAVVAWTENGNVYAQRINENGEKQWGTGVHVFTGVPDERPLICEDGVGGAFIAIERYLNHVSSGGVLELPINSPLVPAPCAVDGRFSMIADGLHNLYGLEPDPGVNDGDIQLPIGNPRVVLPGAVDGPFGSVVNAGYDFLPVKKAGGVYLSWVNALWPHAVMVQHINGGPQWGCGIVASTCYTKFSISQWSNTRLARDGYGGLLISWFGFELFENKGEIRVQRFNSDGAPQWALGGLTVLDTSTAGGNPLDWWFFWNPPALIDDGNGGAYIAWEDFRDLSHQGTDIRIQHVDYTGIPLWTANGQWVLFEGDTPDASGTEANPVMVKDLSSESTEPDGVVIAFQDLYKTYNVWANRIGPDGTTIWSRCLLWDDHSTGTPVGGNQTSPRIIFDGWGPSPLGAIVAWNVSGGDYENNAQKIEISNPQEDDED